MYHPLLDFRRYPVVICAGAILGLCLFSCGQRRVNPDAHFLEQQNAAAPNGDYFATYPLHHPDSCFIKLKAEVPKSIQPFGALSIWYRMPRDPEMAFHFLDLYEKNYPHDSIRAFGQVMRAEYHVNAARFDSAQACLEEAGRLYQKLNKPLGMVDAKHLLGRQYAYQNRFAEAIQTYLEGIDLLNAFDTTFSQYHLYLYHDLAMAYERSNNPAKGLYWLLKAWHADHSRISNEWVGRSRLASAIAMNYLRIKPDSSLNWAQTAIAIQEKELKQPISSKQLFELGRAYFMQGNCQNALPCFLDANRKNQAKHEKFGYYKISHALGECYLCLGKLDSAEFFLKEALPTPDTGNLASIHDLLGRVYAARGDFRRALLYEQEGRRLANIKLNTDKYIALADAEARYQTAQKERKIAELELEGRLNRLKNLILGLCLLLGLVLLAVLYIRQRTRLRLFEQEKQMLEDREVMHMQALALTRLEVQSKNKALRQTTQLLDIKNRLIRKLEMQLGEEQADGTNNTIAADFSKMKILTKDDWEAFQEAVEQQLPGFSDVLSAQFPDLTNAERRLFILLKLEFSSKEIADMQGISVETVWRNRNRLRKKLQLGQDGNLDQFVQDFTLPPEAG